MKKKTSKLEAKARIEKLKKIINEYRYAYHVLDEERISPEVLDSLKKELFDLEQLFPDLITPDSPTQRVGGQPLSAFKKVHHRAPMLSFNDAFSSEDLRNWEKRNLKILSESGRSLTGQLEYFCELKIDGLAIKLIYENGLLTTAATRGDGYVGEEVTANIKTIEAIPLKINSKFKIQNSKFRLPAVLEVAGEIFISKKDLQQLNEQRRKIGETPFANPRNAAAGSIRQLDSKITATRRLDSFAYALVTDLGQTTHSQEHLILKSLGFKINPHTQLCRNLETVAKFRDDWQARREQLSYEVDGIVVQINNNESFVSLGVVGKAPRAALAFKFSPKQATSKVEAIVVQIGRTGILTPVAVLQPVEIGGVTVSRASLHNEAEIGRLGVKVGDTVIVGRAGDVIPQVIAVLTQLRTGKEKLFTFPKTCPICKNQVNKDGAYYRCANKNCFALQQERLYHFVSKPAFDIVGLGPKIIDKLIEAGLVADAADLFSLRLGQLRQLEGFDVLSEKNILNSIASRRRLNLTRFIYALGILHLGEENSRLLADFLRQKGKITKPADLWKIGSVITDVEYDSMPGFGPQIVASIHSWFQDQKNKQFLNKLEAAGVEIQLERVKASPLTGKSFCFTGELTSMTRPQAKQLVRSFGGVTKDSVSQDLDYLVAGAKPGSKLEQARRLNVTIINEAAFLRLTHKG